MKISSLHITILKLQEEYSSLGGTNEDVTNSFITEDIRAANKALRKQLERGMKKMISSQPNKINGYFK